MKKFLSVLALAGFVMACGDDDEDPAVKPSVDGGFDSGIKDAGPSSDASVRPAKVTNAGAACMSAADCTGAQPTCDTKTALQQPLVGGYCSASCLKSDECGTGDCPLGDIISTIGPVMGQSAGSCYKKCTPGTSGECRDGYVCTSLSAALSIPASLPALARNVCLPNIQRDGGVPSSTDGGVDGGMRDGG